NMGGEVLEIKSTRTLKKFASKIRHSDIIVDAIFGTGLTTDVRGVCKDAIDLINKSSKPIVSVDIPSGIDATNGRLLGRAVRADITATMALAKLGSVIYPGRDYTGELILVDIGLPSQLVEDSSIEWNLIDVDTVKDTLRPRSADTHKGSYGHVLTIGGALGKDGAPIMTGMASMKSGAGLSTVAMAKSLINNTKLELEVMGVALSEESDGTLGKASLEDSINALKGKSVLVFGPGLGAVSLDYAEGLLEEAISKKIPVVIDADGLNLFKGKTALLKKLTDKGLKAVLTPHPGEAARLLNITTKVVEADRLSAAKELSSKTGTVVVLKGSATIVYADGETYINTSGNAGMATAGAGDVLAGMVGALLAQGYTLREAATVGVYMHGLAGDLAVVKAGQTSLTATDIIDFIPSAFEGVVKETGCCG
ncbi:MAG: NAD(P)H-hydrate dehydratase, partial [Deltaproteobacteria bacterium]|nr:NAD(P)H-hydrate dehydratase [Deltaproteobacteria bacterium]